MEWEGKDRRNTEDHDTLVELCQIMKNHVDNFNLHREDFVDHKKEDNVSFKALRDQIGKHAIYIYIGIGILGTLQFLLKH